jgi:NhaP-type Na+/H+ or K+/H+ antiporter
MSVPLWSLFIGILLITMVLAGTLLARLPTSSAMIYLAAGFALGPAGLAVITPDPTRYAPGLELAAEVAVLISLLFLVLRPLSVAAGTLGEPMSPRRRAMISWFGIRGIGSVFYLMSAIRHGVTGPLAQQLVTFTLVTVAASIVVHGMSVTPLMRRYVKRKSAAR